MATCPRCKGHLTEHHRCPRRPVFVALEVLLWAVAGAFAGILLVALIHPSDDLDSLSAAAGAIVAVGLNRAVRR